jgi:iron(III) transport system permease protein
MPAYVLAYAWTDALQYSGPLQARCATGWACAARCGPTCAACPARWGLFVLCLYPYVYLLARTALGERACA